MKILTVSMNNAGSKSAELSLSTLLCRSILQSRHKPGAGIAKPCAVWQARGGLNMHFIMLRPRGRELLYFRCISSASNVYKCQGYNNKI